MILLRCIGIKIILSVFILLSSSLYGQNALYKPHVWTSDDGLPQNSINTIIQDHNGYLVIGTFSGLVKFDGVKFSPYPFKELEYQRVVSLYETKEKELWVGTEDNGVFRIKDNKISHYGLEDGLLNLGVPMIKADSEENIYLLHQNEGIVVFDGEKFTPLDNKYFKKYLIQQIFFAKDGVMWVTGKSGLFYKKKGQALFTKHPGFTPHGGGSSINYDYNGDLIFISQGDGIYKLSTDSLIYQRNAPYIDYIHNSLIKIDSEGNIWAGLWQKGLACEAKDGTVTYWSTENDPSFPDEELSEVLQDREGNIWIGTNGGGLVAMRKSLISTLTESDGLSNNLTLCVTEDFDNNLWIGTIAKGINKWDGKTITNYGLQHPAGSVWSFAATPSGEYWAGSFGQGLFYFDKKQNTFVKDTSFSSGMIISIYWDTIGRNLYVGTEYDGLFKRENNKWVNVIPGNIISERIVNILSVAKNHLWIATLGNGIFEYNNGDIQHYTEDEGLGGNRVRALYQDADSNLWIGTYGKGLSLYRNNQWFTFTKENGLYDNLISAIIEDDFGYLWMSCNRGVFRVSREELLAVANKEKKLLKCRIFTQSHGMSNTETNGGFQSAVWKRRNGQLIFPTVGGISIFNPDKLTIEAPEPIVVIEELNIDNSRVEYGGLVHVQANNRSLSITYTSPVFHDPELLHFKYRLKGFSDDWTDAGDRRTAYFTNLSPGEYEFEVIAVNSSGKASKNAAVVNFKVNPHIYQTVWFQLASIILIIGVILGGFFLRNWQILKRSKELEQIVAEKTEDLNNTIDELKISNQNNERMLSIIGHDLRGPVGNIEQLLSLSLASQADEEDRKEFIQLARSSATTSYNLLNSLLQWSREDKGLASFSPKRTVLEAEADHVLDLYSFQAEEKQINLINEVPPNTVVYADVYMLATILRNTVSNALKYTANKGTVTISAQADDKGVTFSIKDNGMGMSQEQVDNLFSKEAVQSTRGTASEVGTGLGLLLVHDLVKRHEGKIWAESQEGKGTSIFVFLPKKEDE